jgi:hypothetical protein
MSDCFLALAFTPTEAAGTHAFIARDANAAAAKGETSGLG